MSERKSGEVVFERVTKRYGEVDGGRRRVASAWPRASSSRCSAPRAAARRRRCAWSPGWRRSSQGRVLIGGEDVTLRAANERNVSMVFQSYALFPAHERAGERLLRAALDAGEQGPGARARAGEARHARARRAREAPALRAVGRPAAARRRGARRWSSSPRCCCSTSRCPTSTRSCAAACARRSASCSRALDLTVLYVTHDQEEALAVSDRVIVMDGRPHRAAGDAGGALRGPGEPLPGRLHRRRQPRRRRARGPRRRGERSRRAASACPCTPPACGRAPPRWPCGRTAAHRPARRRRAGRRVQARVATSAAASNTSSPRHGASCWPSTATCGRAAHATTR